MSKYHFDLIYPTSQTLTMKHYTPEIEEAMRRFYAGLNEKDRRLYAGIEALKFGHGGKTYIAQLLGCSRNTVNKGAMEVSGLSGREVHARIGEDNKPKRKPRIRKIGAGRHSYEKKWGSELDESFLDVLREHTAGDPMDEKVRWTNLTIAQIHNKFQSAPPCGGELNWSGKEIH